MLGIPVRYLLKHPTAVAGLAAHPVVVWSNLVDVYIDERERRGPQHSYQPEESWERHLHTALGAEWPCKFSAEFWALWPQVMGELEAKGIKAGPMSFLSWNDGDAGLTRTVWCLVRHLRPGKVVETGVAHGVTSRFILEALDRNQRGHLWSIDLPPIEKQWREQVGVAVGNRHAARWSYIEGPSRLRLPKVLAEVGKIDLFIHDSLHSERNVRFELDRAWAALRPGGALVIDDIDANRGFYSFTQSVRAFQSMICEAEPLYPDTRRFNQKGLFGIVLKDQTEWRMAA
jgi:hypothetical protein